MSLFTPFYGMAERGMHTEAIGTNLFDGGAPFYGVYETADAQWITLAPIEPQFWSLACQHLGLDDLPDQWDTARWPAMRERIATEKLPMAQQLTGLEEKVIEPQYLALKDLKSKQLALLAASGGYSADVGGKPVQRERISLFMNASRFSGWLRSNPVSSRHRREPNSFAKSRRISLRESAAGGGSVTPTTTTSTTAPATTTTTAPAFTGALPGTDIAGLLADDVDAPPSPTPVARQRRDL